MKKSVMMLCGMAVFALLLFISCGQNEDAPDTVRDVNILMLANMLGDMGYNDGIVWELRAVEERFRAEPYVNMSVSVYEVTVGSGDERERIEQAFQNDSDLVFAINHATLPFLEPAAAFFPDKRFVLLDMEAIGPNIMSALFKPNEAAFLCGALAALMSETGVIGIVLGADIPVLHDFAVGFIDGAVMVRPDIQVIVSITGNFGDAALAYEIAVGQFERGVDVIFGATGGASHGVIQAAANHGHYVIGVDLDQTRHVSPELARSIITSCLKNFDVLIPLLIDEFLDGSLTFGNTRRFGIQDGAVGIARNEIYFDLVPPSIQLEIDALEAKLVSGEIQVRSALEMTRAQVDALFDSVRP